MFSGHFISGHSGAENKHRKAFSKRSELQKVGALNKKVNRKKSDTFNEDLAAKRLGYEKGIKLEKKINLLAKLPLLLISILVMTFFIYKISKDLTTIPEVKNGTISLDHPIDSGNTELGAYFLFVDNGDYYLDRNRYHEAYLAYVKALELYNSGADARIGLTKTLIKKCELKNKYCDEKEINLKYLLEEGLIMEGEL